MCWSCPVGEALAQVLARAGSRPFMPIEEALLLRELIDAHGLTQRDAARQCARDVSWVQRRLMLLGELPQALLQAVRGARVSSWAATRVFAPLARANRENAQRLLAAELMRQIVYGYDPATQRLQRVFRVVELGER